MLRLVFLPLLLVFVINIASSHGQTFQYSRGWTNGKRGWTSNGADVHRRRDVEGLPELFETQQCERRLNKCLLQIQHFISKQLQERSDAGGVAKFAGSGGINRNKNHNNNSNNNNNNFFGNHHQSSELVEDSNFSGDSII